MIYVINELKFNSEHKNRKLIYRVTCKQESINTSSALTTLDLGPLIQESFPEVRKMSRFTSTRSRIVTPHGEIVAKPAFVDRDFIEMFSLNILHGDLKNLFTDPNSVLITKSLAHTIFGDEYPVGKELKVKFDQVEYLFKVRGIVESLSEYSSVRADMYLDFKFYHENLCGPFLESYPFFTTFLMTSKNVESTLLESKINQANVKKWTGISTTAYRLQKFSRMYLESDDLSNNLFPSGNARILYGLVFLVCLVIIMACLNFGILTTASTISRNKEVGVRKINGASAIQVKQQMIFETFLQAIIALPVALFVAYYLLPRFNSYLNLTLKFNIAGNLVFIMSITTLVILTATISGLFASVISTRVNPVQLLRKDQPKLGLGLNLSKILLAGQMVVLIWFLIVTLIIYKQISFSKSSNLGYNPTNLMIVHVTNPGWSPDLNNPQYENNLKMEDLRQSLLSHPSIKNVSVVYQAPPMRDQLSSGIIVNPETNETFTITDLGCLSNFPALMGYRLKSGNSFSENYGGEQKEEILLNESAVKYLGMENPVGEVVKMDGARVARIVGIVYDFNFQSTRMKIVPLRISRTRNFMAMFDIVIRYQPGSASIVTTYFKKLFSEKYKGYQNEIDFHENMIETLYKKELMEAKILVLGIFLAIFIAVIGILGITLFSAGQQVKEIGIRKINGARVPDILLMLNISSLKWVAIAFIIACPIAWYAMHKWLENFAYKTTLSWWIFAAAGGIAVAIALLTISWQSWRAATRNPVESLRYE
jgi:putative ABC transport system permease protein